MCCRPAATHRQLLSAAGSSLTLPLLLYPPCSPSKSCADQRAVVGPYLNTTASQMAALLSANGIDASAITNITATQQFPIISLWEPYQAQQLALTSLNNSNIAL